MAMKKTRGKTELREWVDAQYQKTPGLKERVEAEASDNPEAVCTVRGAIRGAEDPWAAAPAPCPGRYSW